MGNQHLPGEEVWLVREERTSGERKYYLSNLPAEATLRQTADPNATGRYVTPAANARALSGKASLGHTSVFDQNYAGSASDVQVGFRTLTAPRIYSLPDLDAYPLGQDHIVADESGACSDALTITIQPGPSTGDIIGGPEGATTIVLSSPYQAVRFHRGAANLWIRV